MTTTIWVPHSYHQYAPTRESFTQFPCICRFYLDARTLIFRITMSFSCRRRSPSGEGFSRKEKQNGLLMAPGGTWPPVPECLMSHIAPTPPNHFVPPTSHKFSTPLIILC